jgi:hypothetical protein
MKDAGYRESWSPFGDPDAQDPDPAVRNRFFGKYQGTVVNNVDPYDQGRLLVSVPDVHGLLPSNWAMPCVPLADVASGTYIRPRIGANVWVEFEQGDPQKPIWVGGFWGKFETPLMAKSMQPPTASAITIEGATSGIAISDSPIPAATPGNVVIRAGGYTTTISISAAGVDIFAPRVGIYTAGPVDVNSSTAISLNAPTVSIAAATSFTVAAGAINLV